MTDLDIIGDVIEGVADIASAGKDPKGCLIVFLVLAFLVAVGFGVWYFLCK